MADWTPGPWGIEQTPDTLWVGPMRPDGDKVAGIVVYLPTGEEYLAEYQGRQFANARLIAAAPELLEALAAVINSVPFHRLTPLQYAIWAKAGEAIAKATGAA